MDLGAIKKRLRGPVALAMMPFRDDLSLDTDALRRQIRHMVDGGLGSGGRGVVIGPSGTGEYVTLDAGEHRRVVEAQVEAAAGRLPVVAGVAHTDIREAIALTRQSLVVGADAVMLTPPYYYRLDDDSYEDWVKRVVDATDAPVMLYSQHWREDLGSGVTLEQLARFADIPNVISIKYGAPAVFYEMIAALRDFGSRFAFIDNSLGHTATIGHIHGSSGYIAGPAAWWPEFELRYWDLLEAGQYGEAERYHAQLAPYMQFFLGEEFPGSERPYFFGAAVIKATFEYVGLYGGPVRPPFHELTGSQRAELAGILDALGVPRLAPVPA
jgi:4-hydroxy-tetrahydrodipicolinate synthase